MKSRRTSFLFNLYQVPHLVIFADTVFASPSNWNEYEFQMTMISVVHEFSPRKFSSSDSLRETIDKTRRFLLIHNLHGDFPERQVVGATSFF